MNRREALRMGLGAMACGGLGLVLGPRAGAAPEPPETVVHVVAQRFVFTPREIVLKVGRPVVLEFESLDFTHGFNIPDLKIRTDLVPGRLTKVRLTPDKAGTYDFLCDNFCGEGHEVMNGKIIVKA